MNKIPQNFRTPVIVLITTLALLLINKLLVGTLNAYILQIIGFAGINIMMAVSLNLITGFTGQFSLGHAGFMMIGAYVSAAITTVLVPAANLSPLFSELLLVVALLAGGIASGLCGFIIGLPSLRLKGDYLAIVTLGFGEVIRVLILNMEAIGGARGLSGIPELANIFWIYLSGAVTFLLVWNAIHSTKGKSFMAVREDEIAAESIGIPTTRVKVTAFVISSFFAGIGGGLFAHYMTYLNPSSFTFVKSVEIVAMVVLGGLGSLTGSVMAAVLLTILPELLRSASDWRMVIYALLLIIIMIWRPQGIMGHRELKLKFKSKK